MPTFELESLHKGPVGGIDEAGRGPLAGPVVAAAAVFLDPPGLPAFFLKEIQDSKKLSRSKRESIYEELMELKTFVYGVGMASVEEIDRLNILQATFLAMQRAALALSHQPQTLLIDGRYIPSFKGIKTLPVIRGDNISLSIAAASIIAKVTRDKIMHTLSTDYPLYRWETNVGYGTQQHQEALRAHGITPHHRKSFHPVKGLLG